MIDAAVHFLGSMTDREFYGWFLFTALLLGNISVLMSKFNKDDQ